MQVDIKVHELPGIGRRYEVFGEHGDQIDVVIHHTGRRDLYSYDRSHSTSRGDDEEPSAVIEMSDAQARTLGAILGGAYFKPAMVEELEAVIGELLIEWVTLGSASRLVGHSIADLDLRQQTGMTVVAIVRGRDAIPMPEPSEVLRAEDRLVVVGKRSDFPGFKRLMEGSVG